MIKTGKKYDVTNKSVLSKWHVAAQEREIPAKDKRRGEERRKEVRGGLNDRERWKECRLRMCVCVGGGIW